MLWSIIVGGFIGFLAGAITNKGGAMGVIANVVAGLVGSSVGQAIFGTWGPLSWHGINSFCSWRCNCCCCCFVFLREEMIVIYL